MSTSNSNQETVLVTGGSGFIGSFCVLQLLQQGYNVRTTIRNPKREDDVRAMMKAGGVETANSLSFFVADLIKDEGWDEALKGCDYVLHVASPFPMYQPKNEDDLIKPAKEGTLRVLRAAKDAGVKRVVITSSFAAIGYGQGSRNEPYTEENWTVLDNKVSSYVKSKTLAEQAAWNFIGKEGGSLELSVVNPVGVMGPILGPNLSTSVAMLKEMMEGAIARAPKITFNLVDVRDVADLHIKAMKDPKANGERYLAVAGNSISLLEIANVIRNKFGKEAGKIPSKEMSNGMVKFLSLFMPKIREITPELGVVRITSNEKAKKQLNWKPRSNEESIIASAEGLIKMNLLK